MNANLQDNRPDDDEVVDPDIQEAMLLATAGLEPPPERAAAIKNRVMELVSASAKAAQNTLTVHADAGEWTPIATGVALKKLYQDASGYSFLLRLEAGAVIAAHDHPADEECVVIAGEVCINDTLMRAGDYHLARPGSRHAEIQSPTGALLFLRSRRADHYRVPA